MPVDILSNLWGLWDTDTGLSTIVEAPKATIQWDAAGSNVPSVCGAGNVDVTVFDPIGSTVDTLGSLTITGSETDSQFITAVYNAIKSNSLGYKVALIGTVLYVKAKTGGSVWNGQSISFSGTSGGSGTTGFTGGSDTAVDSGIVDQWDDQSGNGHHLISEAGYEPKKNTNALNGYTSLGKSIWNDAWMRTVDELPDVPEVTVYIVAKHKSVLGNSQDRYIDSSTFYGLNFYGGTTSITGQYKGLGGSKTIGSGFFSFRAVFADGDTSISLNNDTPYVNSFGYDNSVSSESRVSIFSAVNGGNYGDKEICHIRIYTERHDADKIAAVEKLLHEKYRHYTIAPTIVFPPLASKTVGDADFAPGATSDSPATIIYSSSDDSIATVFGGNIHIVGAGTVTITASQNATTGYAASSYSQTLVISAPSQATPNKKFPAGLWFIDGIDLWTTYGIALSNGSADFLKYPPKKESTTHDWKDSNGLDVDLARIFLGPNEGVLEFYIFANSVQDYFNKHDAFINLWVKPGTRRLEISAHNDRSYFIYYKETNNYTQLKKLKPGDPLAQYEVIHRFHMVVVEPEPKLYPGNVYIVTEDGKFLIS